MMLDEILLVEWVKTQALRSDAAHDFEHVRRVVRNARMLASNYPTADLEIVVIAAWCHDCVSVPKDSPLRSQASRLAAEAAGRFLRGHRVPEEKIEAICHAIEAHSFSAGIEPKTLEACIVQDADRLEALGAVGLARLLLVSGALGREFYDPADPFCEHRSPDDTRFALDHLFAKLLTLPALFRTEVGRAEGARRCGILRSFLEELRSELPPPA
jgi:uncharacterized protein